MSTADGVAAGADFLTESHDGSDDDEDWPCKGVGVEELDVLSDSKSSRNFWISGSVVVFDGCEVRGSVEDAVGSLSTGVGASVLSGDGDDVDDQSQPIVTERVFVEAGVKIASWYGFEVGGRLLLDVQNTREAQEMVRVRGKNSLCRNSGWLYW